MIWDTLNIKWHYFSFYLPYKQNDKRSCGQAVPKFSLVNEHLKMHNKEKETEWLTGIHFFIESIDEFLNFSRLFINKIK